MESTEDELKEKVKKETGSSLTWKNGQIGYKFISEGDGYKMGWLFFNKTGDMTVKITFDIPLHNYQFTGREKNDGFIELELKAGENQFFVLK